MKVKVKICGTRSKKSALAAIDAGADFLGFNFVEGSKRKINPKIAKEIIREVAGRVRVVGVFQNVEVDYINELVELLNLDYVQLHGEENQEFISKIGAKV